MTHSKVGVKHACQHCRETHVSCDFKRPCGTCKSQNIVCKEEFTQRPEAPACEDCYLKHRACDRKHPCSACTKRGIICMRRNSPLPKGRVTPRTPRKRKIVHGNTVVPLTNMIDIPIIPKIIPPIQTAISPPTFHDEDISPNEPPEDLDDIFTESPPLTLKLPIEPIQHTRSEPKKTVAKAPKEIISLRSCSYCRAKHKACDKRRPCKLCKEHGQECVDALTKKEQKELEQNRIIIRDESDETQANGRELRSRVVENDCGYSNFSVLVQAYYERPEKSS